jgi:hypothetical protein
VAEQITANGQSLNTVWCQLEEITSLLTSPGRRGENVVVPGRHGVIRTPRKRYTTSDLVLPLRVLGVDRITGARSADPVTQLHENIDELMRVFHRETVLLEHIRGDGSGRTALAELSMDPVETTRERSDPPMAKVGVPLTVFGAFWQDSVSVTQTISGTSGVTQELTAFEGSTAPCSDLLITFIGPVNNPMISHGPRWVKYNGVVSAGRQLVLNTETWQLSPGTGTVWAPDLRQIEFGDGPNWLEIDPTVTPFNVTFTHTGGGSAIATIAGRRKYLLP